jgi:hypothetical protein
MTNSFTMTEYWNAAVLGNVSNELLRAAGDDEID